MLVGADVNKDGEVCLFGLLVEVNKFEVLAAEIDPTLVPVGLFDPRRDGFCASVTGELFDPTDVIDIFIYRKSF